MESWRLKLVFSWYGGIAVTLVMFVLFLWYLVRTSENHTVRKDSVEASRTPEQQPAADSDRGSKTFIPAQISGLASPVDLLPEEQAWREKAIVLLTKLGARPPDHILRSSGWILGACLLDTSRDLLKREQYDKALEACFLLLANAPGSPDGLELSGDIYAAQGHGEKARAHYEKALTQLPSSPRRLGNRSAGEAVDSIFGEDVGRQTSVNPDRERLNSKLDKLSKN